MRNANKSREISCSTIVREVNGKLGNGKVGNGKLGNRKIGQR